jgi:hypothetical protein
MLAREGEHLGNGVNAKSNRTPSAATRSMCGVRTNPCPYAPKCEASSAIAKRMLGRESAPRDAPANETNAATKTVSDKRQRGISDPPFSDSHTARVVENHGRTVKIKP